MCFRSFLSCQNPFNCNMGQTNMFRDQFFRLYQFSNSLLGSAPPVTLSQNHQAAHSCTFSIMLSKGRNIISFASEVMNMEAMHSMKHMKPVPSPNLLVNLEKTGCSWKTWFVGAIWQLMGVFTRQKCTKQWCATYLAPSLQISVSPNSQIFNFQDLR